jgi:hypothetical protein
MHFCTKISRFTFFSTNFSVPKSKIFNHKSKIMKNSPPKPLVSVRDLILQNVAKRHDWEFFHFLLDLFSKPVVQTLQAKGRVVVDFQ